MTFLGCISALAIPMPFIFYKYGKKIRAKSKFAPAPDIEKDKKRDEESRGNDVNGDVEKEESRGRDTSDIEKKESKED